MPDFFFGILKHPFTWGMILGVGFGVVIWFQTWQAKREERAKRMEAEQKLQHADEALSRVQRAGEEVHRREIEKKDAEIAEMRAQVDRIRDELQKSELKLQKEKSEGGGFLGKVRETIMGPGKEIRPAEIVEVEVVPPEEDKS